MKVQHLILAMGLVGSLALVIWGDNTPSSQLSKPVEVIRPNKPTSAPNLERTPVTKTTLSSTPQSQNILTLQNRHQLIYRDKPSKRALFTRHSWTPPPPPPIVLPPAPPMAPPLPFKYLGKIKENEQWQVFLARDNATYIVKENDNIEDIYLIKEIRPPTMALIFLPLNQTQNLTIE